MIVVSRPLALLVRLLAVSPFWASAAVKLYDFPAAIAEVQHLGLFAPRLVAAATIAVQAGGAALIVAGLLPWLGVAALAAFTLMASVIAHAFWAAPPGVAGRQFAEFMANMGLIGGMAAAAMTTGAKSE